MKELHQYEQYFFDKRTNEIMAEFLRQWSPLCCLCTPLTGSLLAEQGHACTILDRDQRFADRAGYRDYNLYRPTRLEERFELIFCDPPFFKLSLSQLFKALRELAHYDLNQKLLIAYLYRRRHAVEGALAPFGVKCTAYRLGYQTVQDLDGRNEIRIFSNLPESELEGLEALKVQS